MSSTTVPFYNDTNLAENFVKIGDALKALTDKHEALDHLVVSEFELFAGDIQILADRVARLGKKVDSIAKASPNKGSFGRSVLIGAVVVLGVKAISNNRSAISKKLDELSAWAAEQQKLAEQNRSTQQV